MRLSDAEVWCECLLATLVTGYLKQNQAPRRSSRPGQGPRAGLDALAVFACAFPALFAFGPDSLATATPPTGPSHIAPKSAPHGSKSTRRPAGRSRPATFPAAGSGAPARSPLFLAAIEPPRDPGPRPDHRRPAGRGPGRGRRDDAPPGRRRA